MRVILSRIKIQLGALILLLISFGLYCLTDGDCSLWTQDQRGYQLLERAEYAKAGSVFSDPMWRGVALFRQGEFDKAASLFAGYDTAEAAFNQGNALVMQGKYESAIARFDRALELRPGWELATINLEIAMGRAKYLEKKGGDGTGGKLGADEIVFDTSESSPAADDEQVTDSQQIEDADLRSVWLRQVQTKPTDFLRAKFAQQYATRKSEGD